MAEEKKDSILEDLADMDEDWIDIDDEDDVILAEVVDGELPEEPDEEYEETDEQQEPEEDFEPSEEGAEEGKEQKKDSFFKKKKKDKRDEQIEELNDKLKRQMAEFDNFRKMFDMGARTIIEKILPVVDNFERGLSAVEESMKEDAFVSGMDKVYKQMMTELENIGVKAIESVGTEFDPEYHNAVMQVESEEYESGVVAQELQKGYMYKDTVVRHSMVAVVQ